MNKALKNRDYITVLNSKYTKYNALLAGMVKQNTVYGRMQKKEVLCETGWISDAF